MYIDKGNLYAKPLFQEEVEVGASSTTKQIQEEDILRITDNNVDFTTSSLYATLRLVINNNFLFDIM